LGPARRLAKAAAGKRAVRVSDSRGEREREREGASVRKSGSVVEWTSELRENIWMLVIM
jgi:hypothetical protein